MPGTFGEAPFFVNEPHVKALDKPHGQSHSGLMAFEPESPSAQEKLWQEYAGVYREWDDLTLARWLAQTLGQLEGRAWRHNHPLIGAYRLAAKTAHERQVWLKRLVTPPPAYAESPCCRAPFLPLLTRDVRADGLICEHCNEIITAFDDLPVDLREPLAAWAQQYEPVHAVAHWDDRQRRRAGSYDEAFESAAKQAEQLLAYAGRELTAKLLEFYAAVVWEDQDECLEVRPEDVVL